MNRVKSRNSKMCHYGLASLHHIILDLNVLCLLLAFLHETLILGIQCLPKYRDIHYNIVNDLLFQAGLITFPGCFKPSLKLIPITSHQWQHQISIISLIYKMAGNISKTNVDGAGQKSLIALNSSMVWLFTVERSFGEMFTGQKKYR